MAEEAGKVVFLRQIVRGGADRSYGIHVAQLAGLPRQVIQRAEEILKDLETEAVRSPGARPAQAQAQQLALFPMSDPVVEELLSLDVSTMTPLEALNTLYEVQRALAGRRKKQQ